MIKVVKKDRTLQEDKSQLAKLMAAENITVRHMQVRTAKFNLKDRVLTCPIWTDMTGVIYDLLMGHEISHALHTPLKGWHDAIVNDQKRKNIKRFLNVVEDARIERIIKNKYPGLRKSFTEAYQELFDRDLFKIKKLNGDYSKMGLIDRINVHFKLGAQALVIFNKEEQKFVDRVATAETWDQVERVAREIYDYQKANAKDKPKQEPQPKPEPKPKQQKQEESNEEQDERDGNDSDPDEQENGEGDESDDSGEESEDGDDSDDDSDDTEGGENDGGEAGDGEESDTDEDDEDSDKGDGEESDEDGSDGDSEDGDGESDDESEDEGESKKRSSKSEPEEGGKSDEGDEESNEPVEPDSETDNAFREAEKTLLDTDAEAQVFFKMPKANLDEIIVPNEVVLNTFESGVRAEIMRIYPGKANYEVIAMNLNKVFHASNKNYIQMLVKEFEMRKNASQYSRQLTAKSGELDGNRIARYKLTNDIFRKVTTITKGKSHGMIMFLDMSSSMIDASIVRYVVEQALILATFCKRVGIPFDLYGFTDGHSYRFDWLDKKGTRRKAKFDDTKDPDNTFNMNVGSFCLRHLLSSKFNGNHYKRAFNMLNMWGELVQPNNRSKEVAACFPVETFSLSSRYTYGDCKMGMHMGGTPFIETLVASKELIKMFKNEHHSDIVNMVYLTDGDGNKSMQFPYAFMTNLTPMAVKNTKFGVTDPDTKVSVLPEHAGLDDSGNYLFNMFQASLTELIQATSGARHIGYYFGTKSSILQRLAYSKDYAKHSAAYSKKLKEDGYVSAPNLGYSNFYYVDVNTVSNDQERPLTPGMHHDELFRAFSFNQHKKQCNKLIARQFAAEVAE